ncbi:MAG: glutathione S-transferase family protein [Rubrivivax sp.]|nr:glutathione S-transferase family protein [Rubrivivax sp.]
MNAPTPFLPILHQFAISPYSEKLRLVFGFKRLRWAAVEVPIVMPKPDVVALTGGYRKTPILQLGADIYCDTALAAKVIERIQPSPTLYPASAPLAEQLAQWADSTFFWSVTPWAAQPAAAAFTLGTAEPDQLKAFAMDRAALTAGMKHLNVAESRIQIQRHCAAFERQLADGRDYLFGAEASIADFSVMHGLWFIRRATPVAGILEPYAALGRWLDRMARFGHGERVDITSTEAVALAASTSTHAAVSVLPGQKLEAGMRVTVAATDYGVDPVAGVLVGLNDEEVVVRRTDERAGTVHVHFPRAGFQVRQVKE